MIGIREHAFLWAFAAAVTAAAGTASAQEIQRGRMLAEENCAKCHTITDGGAFKEFPPSFASIGVYRSDEQIRARIIMPPYHSSMPRFLEWKLEPSDVDDIIAYIRSLEPAEP